jgi:diaminopropionate ammonia-lyase
MTRRALAQLPDVNQITHVFAHGGVGSIASTSPRGAVRHALVGVLQTICAGLACREVSPAAWVWTGSRAAMT